MIIVLLLLLIQVSRCQDKTDLKIVRLCPTSKEEWDSAAQKKNCSKFVSQDTHEEHNEYHCLINAYLNETVEVCARKKLILGYCTEYNVAGRFIQNHEEAKCNKSFPRCDKSYSSTDAYKYPDCYQIVYDKRNKGHTTYLPPQKTTLVKDEEDNGNTRAIAAPITAVVFVIIVISLILFIKKKRTGKKKNEFDEEQNIQLMGIKAVNGGKESIEYFHFKVKNFAHFKYIHGLTRNYTQNNVLTNEMQLKDIIFKIGLIGKYQDDNLELFPKGKTNLNGKIPNVWEAVPVLCFQNDRSFQSALETLSQSSASHRILVTSEPVCETDKVDDTITIIGQTKEEIMKTITFCLEQPFRHMLEQSLKDLQTKDSRRPASKRSAEIKALLKETMLDKIKETVTQNLPDDIQDYLFRFDGFERAELGPYSLDVLVDKTTDETLMKDDLTTLNPSFLDMFPLTIRKGTLIRQKTGGFVKTKDNDDKINNSTCGHIVPKDTKVVYTKGENALQKYE